MFQQLLEVCKTNRTYTSSVNSARLGKRKQKKGEENIWLVKPSNNNQGKGIYLVKSLEELDKLLTSLVTTP